jgi:AAA+ ATPase superfamily predicted ATPase
MAEVVERSTALQFIIFYEFGNLVRNEPGIASVFQKLCDRHLSDPPNLRLVFTGSLTGTMIRKVLSYRASLYGRATSILRLGPLPYAALLEIFYHRPHIKHR